MKWHGDRNRMLIKELNSVVDSVVTIKGRVSDIRNLGGISFVNVIDRTGLCHMPSSSKRSSTAALTAEHRPLYRSDCGK
jgi:aspartyl/asparaginyl-tRNA synthetase